MELNGVAQDEEHGYGVNRVLPLVSSIGDQIESKKKQNDDRLSKTFRFDELVSAKVWRASLAEILGTAFLVFAIDTIVISFYETETKMPNLLISVWIAITVAVLLLATSPISGGHMNPIITIAAMFSGLISVSRAAIYIFAQCVGAIVGALAVKAVISDDVEKMFSLGGCTVKISIPSHHGPVKIGLETNRALWLEIIFSFFFLFSSVWMAFDVRQRKALGRVAVSAIIGFIVGLIVFVSSTLTATKGYGGVGMNPARCLGPAVVRGGHLWDDHWVFWVGPAIACVAFGVYTKAIPPHLVSHY